jgi:hypothetical protein
LSIKNLIATGVRSRFCTQIYLVGQVVARHHGGPIRISHTKAAPGQGFASGSRTARSSATAGIAPSVMSNVTKGLMIFPGFRPGLALPRRS